MIIRVTFKTPDAVDMAIQEAVQEEASFKAPIDVQDGVADELKKSLSKFVRYSECITVEFDTEAGTATVIPL